jgi:hypothetical protein
MLKATLFEADHLHRSMHTLTGAETKENFYEQAQRIPDSTLRALSFAEQPTVPKKRCHRRALSTQDSGVSNHNCAQEQQGS